MSTKWLHRISVTMRIVFIAFGIAMMIVNAALYFFMYAITINQLAFSIAGGVAVLLLASCLKEARGINEMLEKREALRGRVESACNVAESKSRKVKC